MSEAILRPNGTYVTPSMAVVGAATDHQALADSSTGTYCSATGAGQFVYVDMDNLTLPAGAVVKDMRVRFQQNTGAAGQWNLKLVMPDGNGTLNTALSQNFNATASAVVLTSQRVTAHFDGAALTDSMADAAKVLVMSLTTYISNVFAVYLDVTYVEQPVVTVDGPSGTITDTNVPTVEWSTDLDGAGGVQTRYEVKVFSDAQYGAGGFDPDTSTETLTSGETLSDAVSWAASATLPDDTYRVYVRAGQTVNGAAHWSDWEFSEFTVDVALPAVPSLSVVPEDAAGRVLIEVASNSGTATTDAFMLERSDDDGATWTGVRSDEGDDGLLVAAAPVVYDYEPPNGATVTYRARAGHDYSGVSAWSGWVEDTVVWQSTQWWIKHPTAPALNVPVTLVDYGPNAREARLTAFQGIGAADRVVVSDSWQPSTGTLILLVDDEQARSRLVELFAGNVAVLLQGPAEDDEPDRWVRPTGVTATRVVPKSWVHIRRLDVPWLEVGRPDGAQTGEQYDPAVESESVEVVLL